MKLMQRLLNRQARSRIYRLRCSLESFGWLTTSLSSAISFLRTEYLSDRGYIGNVKCEVSTIA